MINFDTNFIKEGHHKKWGKLNSQDSKDLNGKKEHPEEGDFEK